MKKNLLLLAAMLLVSTASFADRVLPRPASQPVQTNGSNQYFYNVEYGAFLVGANDWGTRASVARDKGLAIAVTSTGTGIYKLGAMSPDGVDGVWIDGSRDGNQTFGFNALAGNNVQITNSKFPGTVLTSTCKDSDTRLYFTTSTENGTWYSVSTEEYNRYISDDLQAALSYFAALPLKTLLDKANECEGLEYAREQAIYNNEESPIADINAAIEALSQKITEWEKTHIDWSKASLATPIDLTELVVKNPQPTSAQGWIIERPYGGNGPMLGSSAFEYWAGNATNRDNASFKYYQTIEGLPEGIYRVSAMCAQSLNGEAGAVWNSPSAGVFGADGAAMYTDLVKTPVDDCGNVATRVKLSAIVPYGGVDEFTMGVASVRHMDGRWFVANNFQLEYLGKGGDAYALLLPLLVEEAEAFYNEYMDFLCDDYYAEGAEGLPSWKEALEGNDEEKQEAAEACSEWLAKAKKNIAYFEQIKDLCAYYTKILDILEQNGQDYSVVWDARLAIAIIMSDVESLMLTNGEAEEFIAKDIITSRMYIIGDDNQMANATMEDALDANMLIVNRNCVKGQGGWSTDFGAGGTYNLDLFPCGEFYKATFNTYQTLKKLPQGTYEFSCQGFDRRGIWEYEAAEDLSEDVTEDAYIYAYAGSEDMLNEAELTSVDLPFARGGWATEKPDGADGLQFVKADSQFDGMYFPNSMVDAGAWFQAGYYQAGKIRIYVEEGQDIVIGARKDIASQDGNWAILSNFTCRYCGPDNNAGVTPTVNRLDPSGVPTAIEGVNNSDAINAALVNGVYNLAGQRSATVKKGINIINGVKILVK